MAWRRALLESAVWCAARLRSTRAPAGDPSSIFVLRNNDIGDLLIVTPLFDALRRRFPRARICAGVGAGNADLLRGNPHVSDVISREDQNEYGRGKLIVENCSSRSGEYWTEATHVAWFEIDLR